MGRCCWAAGRRSHLAYHGPISAREMSGPGAAATPCANHVAHQTAPMRLVALFGIGPSWQVGRRFSFPFSSLIGARRSRYNLGGPTESWIVSNSTDRPRSCFGISDWTKSTLRRYELTRAAGLFRRENESASVQRDQGCVASGVQARSTEPRKVVVG